VEDVSAAADFAPLAGGPVLPAVMYPRITIADRVVEVVVTDTDERDVTLRFRPYQALRLTTMDCYLGPDALPRQLDGVQWSRASAWLEELTGALSEIDLTADFMQRAIHFLVPAGDDVLEVVAWRIQVEPAGAAATWWPDEPS
jgi:hypothetical protein